MKIRQEASRYAMLVLGAAILAFGLYNVHSQSHITEGGVLGMTLLLEHWLGVSPAVSEVVLDGICYALGLRYLGKAFLPHALAATGLLCPVLRAQRACRPCSAQFGRDAAGGRGSGRRLCGRGRGTGGARGGAAGGDDALALVISKKLGWRLPMAYLATDLTVLLLSLSYIPPVKIACSLVTVTISSFLIGKLEGRGEKAQTTA